MKIIAKVKFNDRIAVVLDSAPIYEYEQKGNIIYGTDGIYYQCYKYDRPSPGFRAFAGREFDIPLKNGEVVHCYSQWWDGGYMEAESLLGIKLVNATYQTKKRLKSCYVFCGGAAEKGGYKALLKSYNGPIYEYYEYEEVLKKEEAE